jgi:hypothetical protein
LSSSMITFLAFRTDMPRAIITSHMNCEGCERNRRDNQVMYLVDLRSLWEATMAVCSVKCREEGSWEPMHLGWKTCSFSHSPRQC